MTYLKISGIETYSSTDSVINRNPNYKPKFSSDHLLKQAKCIAKENIDEALPSQIPTSVFPQKHPSYPQSGFNVFLTVGCEGDYVVRTPSSAESFSHIRGLFSEFENDNSQVQAHFENVDHDQNDTSELVLSHFDAAGNWVESVVIYFSPVAEAEPAVVQQ